MCLDDALTATPLSPTIQRIFDVGTGTGIWAIEMGDAYPSAQITGVDISPIQPVWVPPNVLFEIDDVTKPWLRTPNSIDFVHVRNMVGSIRDWKGLFSEALEHLKPGGTIEVTDIRTRFECLDGTFEERGKSCKEWADTFHEIAGGMGMDFDPTPKVEGWLREVGFENLRVVERVIPVGSWPKNRRLKVLGAYYLSHMLDGGESSIRPRISRMGGADGQSSRNGELFNDAVYQSWLGCDFCACAAWEGKNGVERSRHAYIYEGVSPSPPLFLFNAGKV
jgi:hypothetical protein